VEKLVLFFMFGFYYLMFSQECRLCFFGGLQDHTREIAELRFGVQVLGNSHNDCFIDAVSLTTGSAHKPVTIRSMKLKLEKIISRTATGNERESTSEDNAASVAAYSRASTRRIGPIKIINALIEGEPRRQPIMRYLRIDQPQSAGSGVVRGWVQYDTDVGDTSATGDRPTFSLPRLQSALISSALPLPQLSGRWRLEEVRDYPGVSYFTVIAIPVELDNVKPLAASDSDGGMRGGNPRITQCVIFALQSNDKSGTNHVYFRVGRGRIEETDAGSECHIFATLAVTRLRSGVHYIPYQHRLRINDTSPSVDIHC
jgi:hypothetical protein